MNQKLKKYVKTEDKTIQGVQPSEGLLAMALNQDLDLDRMKLLIEMKKDEEDRKAKRDYAEAMAQFKKERLVVLKDMKNKQYNDSPYASKGHLVNTVIPILAEYGFSHKWKLEQEKGLVKVTCIITHSMGHSESSSFEAPPDKSGSKNPIQEIKSTRTYGEVITFEDAVGIAACDTDLDDDGNAGGGVEYITEEQADEIRSIIQEIGDSMDFDQFLIMIDATSIDTILAVNYKTALKKLGVRTAALEKKKVSK